MPSILEPATEPRPSLRQVLVDFGPTQAANGFIGFIFSATGPLAIILAVGTRGGLTPEQLSSWVFGCYFINGLITIAMSWLYRQPLGFFWTIPGTVLVGPALAHLSFAEVIGAYYATSLLILVLGATGSVKRAMQAVPMPIVMGMVAGVFLRFGLDIVRALHTDLGIAGPMLVAFLLLSGVPALGRRLPPIIGALLVGAIATVLLGRIAPGSLGGFELVQPVVPMPVWSLAAIVELMIPLAITVLVVQNGQGFAVLQAAGHQAPVNAVSIASGIGAALSAAVGAVSTCLTGPTNAIIVSSGERSRHYTGAIFVGVLAVVFGLLSPGFTRLMLAAPKEYIMMLGGLAMLRVLQSAFVASFKERFSLGALVAFIVTVADLGVFNIGAAFWGLVAGVLVSYLMERGDYVAMANRNADADAKAAATAQPASGGSR